MSKDQFNKEVHVTLPTRLWNRLYHFTEEYALGISSLIREAIYDWVEKREKPMESIYREKEGLQKRIDSLYAQLEQLSEDNQYLRQRANELEAKLHFEETHHET